MKTNYVAANKELALVLEDNFLPCALKLDMVDESICITSVIVDIDVPGWTIFDTENRAIYWAIPRTTVSNADSLLNHIAPLAELIISQSNIDIDYTGEPQVTSAHAAIVQISRYINDLEFLETRSDIAKRLLGNRPWNADMSPVDCFVHRN